MELNLNSSINKFFWTLFPFFFIFISYSNIFNNWQLQNYGFNELEDIGRLVFVLGLSACESALTVVFLWLIYSFFKRTSN